MMPKKAGPDSEGTWEEQVWGFGLRVEGLGIRVWGFGFRVEGSGFGV